MPEIRARRRLRTWKWSATICALVIAGAWFTSRWVWLECVINRSDGYAAMVQSGRVWVYRRAASPFGSRPLAFSILTASETDSIPEWRWRFEARASPGGFSAGSWSVYVPLWALFVVAAAPTVLLWRKDRPLPAGACVACGYDRSGLAARSACPECGAKAGPEGSGLAPEWNIDLSNAGRMSVCGAWAVFMIRTFTFQLGLLAAAAAIGLAVSGRMWAGAAVGIVSLLAVGPTLVGMVRWRRAAREGPTLTVITANLEYGRADAARLAACIRATRPDVVLFQEYTSKSARELPPLVGAEFPHRFEHAREDGFGQAVYSRHALAGTPRVFSPGCDDPQVRAEIVVGGATIAFVNVHLVPPSTMTWVVGQRREAARLAGLARQEIGGLAEEGALIIAGDFNATAASPHLAVLRGSGLREAHAAAGLGRGTTWPRRGPLRLAPGIRIDHILFAGGLECVECGVCGDVGSDHRPTFARFVRRG